MLNKLSRDTLFITSLLFFLGWNYCTLNAQNQPKADSSFLDLYQNSLELFGEQFDNTADFYQFQSNLEDRLKNKLNINQVTANQLFTLRILTNVQINAIIDHRKKFGLFKSLYELQSIPELSEEDVLRLIPYLRINEFDGTFDNKKAALKIMSRFNTVYPSNSVGYASSTKDSIKFLGPPLTQLHRIIFNPNKKLAIGLTLYSQIGEPIGFNYNKTLFDYIGGYIHYHPSKRFSILIGNFVPQFGQGLNSWKGLGLNRVINPVFSIRAANGLSPYMATNDYLSLIGVGASYKTGKVHHHIFAGYNNYDARLFTNNIDSTGYYNNFILSGLHRNYQELSYKNNVKRYTAGLASVYSSNQLEVGAAITGGYNTIHQRPNFYDKDYFADTFFNGSIFHSYHYNNFRFFGEIASDYKFNIAIAQGMSFSLNKKSELLFSAHYFDPNYYAPLGASFSYAILPRNERGFYFGLIEHLRNRANLNISLQRTENIQFNKVNIFSSPYYQYIVDYAKPNGFSFRYRMLYGYQTNPRLSNIDQYLNQSLVQKQYFRLQFDQTVQAKIGVRTRVEVCLSNHQILSKGIIAYQDFFYKELKSKHEFNARLMYFSIESFDARIYAYEYDLTYKYAVNPYSGQGFRTYLVYKFRPTYQWSLQSKIGWTLVPDAKTLGSGLNQINGNYLVDVGLQVIYQLSKL
jgi:hypothetical protein